MPLLLIIFLLAGQPLSAQPRYDLSKMQRERLDRGVVAVRCADGSVFVSWRLLESDADGQPFVVYRNGELLTQQPLSTGGTWFVDSTARYEGEVRGARYEVREGKDEVRGARYEVRGGGIDGQYTLAADSPVGYMSIPISSPGKSYSANDASVGDVDGDGQYEIFLKWEPRNARDNSHAGFTDNTYIDCMRLDGTRLWRLDLGRNIRSGAHYTPFLVYDFDGDGRAELMVKTADGTIDGIGHVIGDAQKDWRCTEPNKRQGRIMDGPEFLSVFDGLTGRELATVPYVPDRGAPGAWGDDYGNRSERYLAAVAYLDGVHASAVFCRGYYTRSVLVAWDWDGKELRSHWVFDTDRPGFAAYAGQGNHNLRVADVDGDGCDEIVYGSMCVDHDGSGLYTTGFGHGDALHMTAFDPQSDRLQVWSCHENGRDGSTLRDAATGELLFQVPSNIDVGRCMAADIDPRNPGLEMWSADSHGIRNMKGEVLSPVGRRHIPMNFGIWWDGDLLRELLDHEQVLKYDWTTGDVIPLIRFEGCRFNNWTKSNPCLSADILGDWREEVLVRNESSTELRLYVSTIPTYHRIGCLMNDIPYRLSVATENVGYNQPPETGRYLGERDASIASEQ